ncbi:hypothetical protein [Imbroritus primus]
MADIKNYTLNFGSGRPAGLTVAVPRLAFTEIKRVEWLRSDTVAE